MRVKIVRCEQAGITLASNYIKNGGVIVYPTDTVYGLGCDPYNKEAVEKVFSIKGRSKDKPLPILSNSIERLESICVLDNECKLLASRFWPGALTIITKLKDNKLKDTLNLNDRIGVRIPANDCTLRLLSLTNGLLVGTSANISTYKSAKSVDELDPRLMEKVDLIIDGGTSIGIESTVIDMIDKRIVREGYIKKGDIERVLGYEL